jgi:hypothetical protein
MPSSEVLCHVAVVRTSVSKERSASIIRVTRIGELGTTLAVTVNVVPSSPILITLVVEAIRSSESLFLQEPHGVTTQKTPFFTGILFPIAKSSLYYAGNEAALFMRLHLLQAIVLFHQNRRQEASKLLARADSELSSLKLDDCSLSTLMELGA